MNTPVGRAVATASLVSIISTNVASSSNGGSFSFDTNKSQNQKLMAMLKEIYENGKDPVITQSAVRKFIKESNPIRKQKQELTGWSSASINANGETVHTYSGTVDGYLFVKSPMSLPMSGTTCAVETYSGYGGSLSGFTKQGTAIYSEGELRTKSGSLTTVINKATVKFNDFGSLYTDTFGYYKSLKELETISTTDCPGFQALHKKFAANTKPVTMKGTILFENHYSSAASASSLNFTTTSLANSNDLVITHEGRTTPSLTIEGLKMIATSALVSSGSSFSGKFNIAITGKINGVTLAESITVEF